MNRYSEGREEMIPGKTGEESENKDIEKQKLWYNA